MRTTLAFLFVELVLLALLSDASEYAFKRAGYYVNFAIITMLTPMELVGNLIFGQNPDLHPFYFRVLARDGLWSSLGLALYVLAIVLFALAWLFCERRRSR